MTNEKRISHCIKKKVPWLKSFVHVFDTGSSLESMIKDDFLRRLWFIMFGETIDTFKLLTLQRRLYGICTACFLMFLIPYKQWTYFLLSNYQISHWKTKLWKRTYFKLCIVIYPEFQSYLKLKNQNILRWYY